MSLYYSCVFYLSGDPRDLHLLSHSFPTRRPSDLAKLFARCFQPAHSLSPCIFVVRRNRELVAFPIERHTPDIVDRLVLEIGKPAIEFESVKPLSDRARGERAEIGSASCRERVWQYVSISVVDVS